MGRMPPKSKPKEGAVTAGTSPGRGGRAAARVTRSTPSKVKAETSKSPSPRRRGPTATVTSETAGPSTAKGKSRGGTAEPETPSKNVQKTSPKKTEEKGQKTPLTPVTEEKAVDIVPVDEDSRDNEVDPLSSIDNVASDDKNKGHKDIASSSEDSDEDSDDTVPLNSNVKATKSLPPATTVPESVKRPGPLSKTMVGNTPDKNKKKEENKAKSKPQVDEEEKQQSGEQQIEKPTALKKKKTKKYKAPEIRNKNVPKKDIFDELNGKRMEIPETLEPEPSDVDSDDPDHEKVKKSRNNMEQVLLQEGTNIFATMDSQDVHELLRRIDSQCTPMDRVSIARREKAIDWDSVAFSSFGPRQCKAIWIYLRHHARSFRIMSEVVSEIKAKFTSDKSFQSKLVESLPGYPRKPPTAQGSFHCYNREMWEKTKRNHTDDLPNFITFQNQCRKEYEALPIEVKAKYQQQSEEAAALYKQEVKAFYAENPGIAQYLAKQFRHKDTPVKKAKPKTEGSLNITSKVLDPYEDAPAIPQNPVASFINGKLNRIDPPATGDDLTRMKHHFYDKYKNLSDKKRVKWIDSCIQDCIMYYDYVKEYQLEHPGFKPPLKLGNLLKAEEQILWENANGKPENPKSAASELFCDEFLQSNENEDLSEEERRTIAMQKWNEMDWYHKEMYTMKFKISVVEYRKQIQEFFAKVPEFMKPYTLRRIHKKFWKMLLDVDKEVDIKVEQAESPTEMLITADHGVVLNDGSHKTKKSKKRKREHEDDQDLGLFGLGGEEGGDGHLLESELGDNDITAPKKKKKKKKRHNDDEMEDEDDIPNSPNCFPNQTHLKFKKETERMYGAGDRVAYELDQNFVQQHKHSAKYFPQGNKVSKNDIYEAVRGIFDSRNHLGRKFTVYYYYAKYVATEKVWIDLMCEKGLEEAAKNIINTFLALPGAQQDIFVEKSKEFHIARRYTDDFPDEPVPPPKNPKGVYTRDLTKKKPKKPTRPTPWHALSEDVQIFYMKRLYHETKIYMRNYDAFISNLTPSDLVNYAIYRYRKWEARMYMAQSIIQAKQEFVFPFKETEQKTTDFTSGNELQLIRNEQRDSRFPARYRKESNPFTELDSAIEKATRAVTYVPKRNRKEKWTGEKAQWDEVDEKVVFSLLLSKEETRRYKLKAFEMYNYPLDDILPKTEPDQEEEFPTPRYRIMSEGTQTDWTSMSIINGPITFNSTSTQTRLSHVKKQCRSIPLDGLERFKGKDLEMYQKRKSWLVNDVHSAITKVLVPSLETRPRRKPCQRKLTMKQIFNKLKLPADSGMSEKKKKPSTQSKKNNNSNTAARKRVAVAKKRSNSNYSKTNNIKKAKPRPENKRKRVSTSKTEKQARPSSKTKKLLSSTDLHIVELEAPSSSKSIVNQTGPSSSSSKSNQTGPISIQHEQPEVYTIIGDHDIESYVNIAPLTPVAEFYGDASNSGECDDMTPVTSFPVQESDENEVNILTLL